MRSLKDKGFYLFGNPGLSQLVRGLWISMRSSKKVIGGTVSYRSGDLIFLKELIEAGEIKSAVDKSYPLGKNAETHRYVDTGEKKGKGVITVGHKDRN